VDSSCHTKKAKATMGAFTFAVNNINTLPFLGTANEQEGQQIGWDFDSLETEWTTASRDQLTFEKWFHSQISCC
jgi:hypothetical protein